MGLSRRRFLQAVCTAVAAAVAGCTGLLLRWVPLRVVRALRVRRFVGRLRPLDASDIAQPAKWNG